VLLAGFALLAGGLAVLTPRRAPRPPLRSGAATRRALQYALVYGLCTACFARLVAPALLGSVRSPWLWALGDVLFVTLALFTWVLMLAEEVSPADVGLRGGPAGRVAIATLLGLALTAVYAFGPLGALAEGRVRPGQDALVFALLAAAAGSAIPEEVLFRGFLMGSLDGRMRRWARVAVPALAFTAVRAVRFLPGPDLALDDWLFHVFGTALPLGLWWGVVRDLARGSLWPSLISHFTLEFTTTLVSTTTP
jgi:membrane protease YdiL (CAAX protease family)